MNSNKLKSYFKQELKDITIANCFINLLNIPINLLSAALLSDIIIKSTNGNIREVAITAVILLTIILGKSLFNIVTEICIKKRMSNKLHNCKLKLYTQLFLNPLYILYSLKHGETKEKINDDFNTVTNKYISEYPNFIIGLFSFVIYFTYLLIHDWMIAFTLFVISFLQIIPPLVIEKYLQINYDNCRDIEAKITDFTIEGYRGFLTIKLYGLKQWWQDKLAKYHKEYSKIGNSSIFTGTAESTLNDLIFNILRYGTYGIIGLFILQEYSSLDIGIQAIAISGSFFGTVKSSFDLIKNLAVSKMAEVRLYKSFVFIENSVKEINKGDIEVSGISYSYNEKEVLSNVTASFDSSKIIIVKGNNGSGKSTVFRLIVGLLENQIGKITIDGISSRELAAVNFPKKIFFLPQDDATFNFSANELYNMIIPEKKIEAIKIAKNFNINDDLINKSKIRELSGGERKKIFLSLAFAVNPIIMMLDEPTNSLDEDGKKLLKKLLQERESGAIIITHDSFCDDITDCLYVLGKGEN